MADRGVQRRVRHGSERSLLSTRSRVVWASLLGAMTVGGGLLGALSSPSGLTLNGRALTPMLSTAGPSHLEAVLSTRRLIEADRWRGIVVHHSGAGTGSPAELARDHRAAGLTGLGYHFVIGNGRPMGDGEIYVGRRWLDQAPGAHVGGSAGEAWNLDTIGICLVGDGDRRPFTEQQVERLARLVRLLCDRLGIPASEVVLHRDLAATSSPGRYFPATSFFEMLKAPG